MAIVLEDIRAVIDGSTFVMVDDRSSEPSVVYNGIEAKMPDTWDDCEVTWMRVHCDCTLYLKINPPFVDEETDDEIGE